MPSTPARVGTPSTARRGAVCGLIEPGSGPPELDRLDGFLHIAAHNAWKCIPITESRQPHTCGIPFINGVPVLKDGGGSRVLTRLYCVICQAGPIPYQGIGRPR